MATGGTKGPLQGGTRTASVAKPSGMTMSGDRGAAIKGAGNPAGPRAPKPAFGPVPTGPSEGRIRSMEAGPGKVRAGMGGGTTLSSKPGANAAGAQAAKDAARMGNRAAKGYGKPGKLEAGIRRAASKVTNTVKNAAYQYSKAQTLKNIPGNISALKTGVAGVALNAASDKYLAPLARKAGTALGKNVVIPAARALDDAMPGINSRDERMRSNTKAAKTGNNSRFAGARDKAMAKAKGIKGSPVLGGKKSVAASFDSAFAAARKAGKSGFTFKGKKYTTKMK
jgi:hypothetical protein